jgi:hypothetical protein
MTQNSKFILRSRQCGRLRANRNPKRQTCREPGPKNIPCEKVAAHGRSGSSPLECHRRSLWRATGRRKTFEGTSDDPASTLCRYSRISVMGHFRPLQPNFAVGSYSLRTESGPLNNRPKAAHPARPAPHADQPSAAAAQKPKDRERAR